MRKNVLRTTSTTHDAESGQFHRKLLITLNQTVVRRRFEREKHFPN